MAAAPTLNDATLQALSDILGDTGTGLTGSEIGRHLSECGIADPNPQATKRHRLFQALRARQIQDRCANHVLRFVMHVMSPVRHVGSREHFETERSKLNAVMGFAGYELGEDGGLTVVTSIKTLSEAEARAGAFRKALVGRQVHADVLRFCKAELLVDNYFHAVFEAVKSVGENLRLRTGLVSDGAALVDEALAIGRAGHPRLALNALSTESERNEQSGLTNIVKGLFSAFRNTAAHAPKITWPISEQDALDILSTVSLVHRRLDAAVRTHIT